MLPSFKHEMKAFNIRFGCAKCIMLDMRLGLIGDEMGWLSLDFEYVPYQKLSSGI